MVELGRRGSLVRMQPALSEPKGRPDDFSDLYVTYKSPPDLATAEALRDHPARRRALPIKSGRESHHSLATTPEPRGP
jgi:hypothetical protein